MLLCKYLIFFLKKKIYFLFYFYLIFNIQSHRIHVLFYFVQQMIGFDCIAAVVIVEVDGCNLDSVYIFEFELHLEHCNNTKQQ